MLSPSQLLPFSKLLQDYALFNLKINHYENLAYTVDSLAKAHHLSLEEYYTNLLQNNQLKQELSEKMCHHFSSFFRDNQHYLLLREVLSNFNKPSIWYVGCSTGEEAYSHAIFMHSHNIGFKKILASDLSHQAIETCLQAIYHKNVVDKNQQKRLLLPYLVELDDSHYKINNVVSKAILFKKHNLADNYYPSKFDIIICHNVLIYFDMQAQKKVASKLWHSLNEGGILMLGKNQSLFSLGLIKHFSLVKTINGCYYVKNSLLNRPRP